jgi:hypothetical protein
LAFFFGDEFGAFTAFSAGVADVLHRGHLGGHPIGRINPLHRLYGPAGIELAHGQQPQRNRRRLITRGLTHHLDEIRVDSSEMRANG